ncbi:MAG: hypothetical protein ACETVQ_00945 [Candidatus Bathyarchaeia archaeon]
MEIKNILSRKSAKLLMLLLINMLVVTVSAAMYYSLSMTSTIDVYAADVYFVEGSDNGTAGGAILTLDSTNTTATITGLRAYPNMTFTYENVTVVRNNATSGTTEIRLAPDVAPSGNATDFVYVKFMLNGTSARWLNYTVTGGSWDTPSASDPAWITINPSTQWNIVIITKANATATPGNKVTIGIKVDVD